MNRKAVYIALLLLLFSHLARSQAARLPRVSQPSFRKDSFYITRYGARGDGIQINTTAINAAITDCNKKGGGVVVIPAGFWVTGPLVLKTNVNLYLQRNALLQFTADRDQYPLVAGNWEGIAQMRNQSPLSATGATNI